MDVFSRLLLGEALSLDFCLKWFFGTPFVLYELRYSELPIWICECSRCKCILLYLNLNHWCRMADYPMQISNYITIKLITSQYLHSNFKRWNNSLTAILWRRSGITRRRGFTTNRSAFSSPTVADFNEYNYPLPVFIIIPNDHRPPYLILHARFEI